MANIAISELETSATTLKNDDYILVSSKNDNGSFTSAKMLGSALKSTIASGYDDSSIQNRLDQIMTKLDSIESINNSYFTQIIDLNTRIGNKIFSGTYGDNKTLTLAYNAQDWNVESPTGGGTYPNGTRTLVIAKNPKDSTLIKFKGWYDENDVLINDGTQSFTHEVIADQTLTAKYMNINYIRVKYTVVNNTNYDWDFESNGSIYTSYQHVTFPKNSTTIFETFNYSNDILTKYILVSSSIHAVRSTIPSPLPTITASKSGVNIITGTTSGDRPFYFLPTIDPSIVTENYDGTYKDYGTITINS